MLICELVDLDKTGNKSNESYKYTLSEQVRLDAAHESSECEIKALSAESDKG